MGFVGHTINPFKISYKLLCCRRKALTCHKCLPHPCYFGVCFCNKWRSQMVANERGESKPETWAISQIIPGINNLRFLVGLRGLNSII